MPELPNQTTKIISLTFFAVVGVLKVVCVFLISGQIDAPCIAGWHLNEELSNHLILLCIGLVPDFIMLLCIIIGMTFNMSNIGADPSTIIYNFVVGLLTLCSYFPFFGVEDCKSDNLVKIKLSGVCAVIAGVVQIANGVICLLFLAPAERDEADAQPTTSTPKFTQKSNAKPTTAKSPNKKV